MLDWKEIIERPNCVFHCRTHLSAMEFLHIVHNLGYTWISGSSLLLFDSWGIYNEETCYDFLKLHGIEGVGFGNLNWANKNDYMIIDVEKVLKTNKRPFKLKRN